MKHTIIYKNKDKYASFPLLRYEKGILTIGFFTAPRPDHMGLSKWKTMESIDQGETWDADEAMPYRPYSWPSLSPREISDRFTTTLPDGTEMATGSCGFKIKRNIFDGSKSIIKSKGLFQQFSTDGWKTNKATMQRGWEIPNADVVLTFPRVLQIDNRLGINGKQSDKLPQNLILVPAYAVLKNGLNRALVWRSDDHGQNWKLYNMFPSEINANEVAFINTTNGILAHIRSDINLYIMESWSEDGIIWTYPTNICGQWGGPKDNNIGQVAGGPSHLLRLRDNRLIDTYGYRFSKMSIRAIVSENEGITWSSPIVLRDDGGYLSGLRKRRFWQRKVHAGNDLGYPVSVELPDGVILSAYYFTGSDRVTCIAMTKWEV